MRCSAKTFALYIGSLVVGAQCRSASPNTTIRRESNPSTIRPAEPPAVESNRPSEPGPPPAEAARPNVLSLEPLTMIERSLDEKQAARAIGTFDRSRNRLAFELRNVSAFSIELASIPIDWSRPVVLSLDRVPVELRRRDTQRLHFTRTPQGTWLIEEPPKNP